MPWKNGGGLTCEIAVFPTPLDTPNSNFDWRISIAEIDNDCPFSTFNGYDRALLMLHGAGMELNFDQAPSVTLREPYQIARFAGEWQTNCRLIAGPTRDFNVITRRGVVDAQVMHRPLVDTMVFFNGPGVDWLIYVANGHAKFTSHSTQAQTGDTLHLTGDTTDSRNALTGAGELLLVRLARHPV